MSFFSQFFGNHRSPAEAEGDVEGERRQAPPRGNRKGSARANLNFPSFRASAIDRPLQDDDRTELGRARMVLRDVFTPSQPVVERTRFAGRLNVLQRLIEIIEEQRSHVVIYGERGIGKTSLMHILADLARESNYIVVYESCGANSNFDEIFRALLGEIPSLYLSTAAPTGPDVEGGRTLEEKIRGEVLNARRVGELCSDITGTRVIFILDEYDRVRNPEFRQGVAELIKNLSDRAARVQLVLAGVANDLQELIGFIPSIRRNVVGLPMPRMSEQEIRSLLRIGEQAASVEFDEEAARTIGLLSAGSPYLVRLIAHHASMRALDSGRMKVNLADVWEAIDRAIEEAESRLSQYTLRHLERLSRIDGHFLGALARAANTPDGWFIRDDVGQILNASGGTFSTVYLTSEVSDEDRAWRDAVLDMRGTGDEMQFRFRDEALPTYLWMVIARDGLISKQKQSQSGEAGGRAA